MVMYDIENHTLLYTEDDMAQFMPDYEVKQGHEKGPKGDWYAVFKNEDDADKAYFLGFSEFSYGFRCFDGYMNALCLTNVGGE